MQPATVTLSIRHALSSVMLLTLASVGCGGSEVQGTENDPTSSGGSAAAPSTTPNPAPSEGAASSSNGGQAPTASPAATGTEMPSTPSTPNEGNTTPAAIDADNVGAACAQLSTNDACGACVCEECGAELDTCATTPGCAEILACVRENDCSGRDCFCGDAALSRCFAGEGDGPCKDVVLAAPGGREPTLSDPSGGPASDAALAVGECADDDDSCSDVCDVGL